MKKNLIIILLLTFAYSLIGCGMINKCRISGNYRSECFIDWDPLLEVELYSDNSFRYSNSISGTWQVKRDTLFLYAEEFKEETVSEEEFWVLFRADPYSTDDLPIVNNGQYTSAEDCDVYLIRGRKLIPMQEDGSFSKEGCALEKLKKNDIPIWRRE